MSLERRFENIIVELAKYTAIPLLIFIPKVPSFGYDKNFLFVILVILDWIFLTEIKIRDTKVKVDKVFKKLKLDKIRK